MTGSIQGAGSPFPPNPSPPIWQESLYNLQAYMEYALGNNVNDIHNFTPDQVKWFDTEIDQIINGIRTQGPMNPGLVSRLESLKKSINDYVQNFNNSDEQTRSQNWTNLRNAITNILG